MELELGVDILLHAGVDHIANREINYCENSVRTNHIGLVDDSVYRGRLLQSREGGNYIDIGSAWFHVYTTCNDKRNDTLLTLADTNLVSNLTAQGHSNFQYKVIFQCDYMNCLYKYPVSKLVVLYPYGTGDDKIVIRPCDMQLLLQHQLIKSGDRINFRHSSFHAKVYPSTDSYSIISCTTQLCILPNRDHQMKSYIAWSHGASLLKVSDDSYLYRYLLQLYQSPVTQQLSNYLSIFTENPDAQLSSLLVVSSDVFHKDISAMIYSMIELCKGTCDVHCLAISMESLVTNGKRSECGDNFYRQIQLVYLLLSHKQKVVLVLPEVDDVWDSCPDVATAIVDLVSSNKCPNLFLIGISSHVSNQMKGLFFDSLFVSLPSHSERKHIASIVMNELEKQWPDDIAVIDRDKFIDGALDTIPRCVVPSLVHSLVKKYKDERDSSNGITLSGVDLLVTDPFSDIIGLTDIKQVLSESIIWPTKYGAIYRDLNMSIDVGILLYGPPGTGKTKLPRVVAASLRYPLLVCKLSEILSGEIGSSEKKLSAIFQEAKGCSPCIIFIDEMQALFTNRANNDERQSIGHSLSSTLAICLDDIYMWNNNASTITSNNQITIIASTNEPWAIDTSFLRSGRFDKLLYVGPLSEDDRRLFITQSITQSIKDYEYVLNPEVVRLTEGFTGADMALLIRKLLLRMYNNSKKEQPLEVNEALTRILIEGGVQKSVSNNELIMYNRWQSSACMF